MNRLALGMAAGLLALAVESSAADEDSGMMGGGMMGKGKMGGTMGMGMMRGSMMDGCPMMMTEPGSEVRVKKVEDGVTITVTSTDPETASRLQKKAEIMRLMHELHEGKTD